MLSSISHPSSSSSIQARRKLHRRQQSLEVPILAAPLPANPRQRSNPAHRRGLSLDQDNLSALTSSPTGYRPRLISSSQDQEQQQPSGPPSVRIRLDTTNLGQPQHPQHYVQATQQQIPAQQPGYQPQPPQDFQAQELQAHGFQAHLQQQLRSHTNVPAPATDFQPHHSPIPAPQPLHPSQQAALQELQQHLEWYQNTFAASNTQPQPSHIPHATNEVAGNINQMPMQMQALPMFPQQQPYGASRTPVPHGHANTVPNTPQNYSNNLASPPPTHAKHARSQSFQLDIAPMPNAIEGDFARLSVTPPNDFEQDAGLFGNDQGYASSAYSSSIADASSPCVGQYHNHNSLYNMPTLFEEPSPPLDGAQVTQGGAYPDSSSHHTQATAGSSIQDFNDPDFSFGGRSDLSPDQALLSSLGPDVPASIVDTGIHSFEVQRYIGEVCPDNKYPCLFEGCNRRFGRKENVRAHVQTHLGDRQFRCNLCEKTFVRQHDLKRHVAIHSDDRPFVCPCGTGFARHDALTRHRQRGMCHGALPGFEKTEEEKPKRGRPKKNQRPVMGSRIEKATKSRKNNNSNAKKANTTATTIAAMSTISVASAVDAAVTAANDALGMDVDDGASPSSLGAGSDNSFPMTPPDDGTALFDADAFLDLAGAADNFTSSWRDTPPTSPVSASPSKTVDSYSSFDYGAGMAEMGEGISPSVLSDFSSPGELDFLDEMVY